MVHPLARLAASSFVVLLAACARSEKSEEAAVSSGAAASTLRGSCDRVASMSVCSTYAASQLAKDPAVLSAGCTKLGGTYVAAACPNTAVLGSCTLGNGETRSYYASGGVAYDGARAQKECTSLYAGAWKPFL